jgi:hypothetical protein
VGSTGAWSVFILVLIFSNLYAQGVLERTCGLSGGHESTSVSRHHLANAGFSNNTWRTIQIPHKFYHSILMCCVWISSGT